MNQRKQKRPWHLEEFWGLNKTSNGNISELNNTNNKKLHANKNNKEVYQYPIRSSDVYGWFKPIDNMVFLGHEREKMSDEFVSMTQKKAKKQQII